jgi:hypothetical protein
MIADRGYLRLGYGLPDSAGPVTIILGEFDNPSADKPYVAIEFDLNCAEKVAREILQMVEAARHGKIDDYNIPRN